MKKTLYIITLIFSTTFIISCGSWPYSFTGGSTGNAKTIQIDFFRNNAPLIEPSLSQKFTTGLQDLFSRQTNLSLVKSGGDLHFEGEITGYRTVPASANAQQTATQNRLTITINVRYFNKFTEKDNFEKTFSHFKLYEGNILLIGGALETAFNEIIERITQDIFNASVAKW